MVIEPAHLGVHRLGQPEGRAALDYFDPLCSRLLLLKLLSSRVIHRSLLVALGLPKREVFNGLDRDQDIARQDQVAWAHGARVAIARCVVHARVTMVDLVDQSARAHDGVLGKVGTLQRQWSGVRGIDFGQVLDRDHHLDHTLREAIRVGQREALAVEGDEDAIELAHLARKVAHDGRLHGGSLVGAGTTRSARHRAQLLDARVQIAHP